MGTFFRVLALCIVFVVLIYITLNGCGRVDKLTIPNKHAEVEFTCGFVQNVPILCFINRRSQEQPIKPVADIVEDLVEAQVESPTEEQIKEVTDTVVKEITNREPMTVEEVATAVVEAIEEIVPESQRSKPIETEEVVDEIVKTVEASVAPQPDPESQPPQQLVTDRVAEHGTEAQAVQSVDSIETAENDPQPRSSHTCTRYYIYIEKRLLGGDDFADGYYTGGGVCEAAVDGPKGYWVAHKEISSSQFANDDYVNDELDKLKETARIALGLSGWQLKWENEPHKHGGESSHYDYWVKTRVFTDERNIGKTYTWKKKGGNGPDINEWHHHRTSNAQPETDDASRPGNNSEPEPHRHGHVEKTNM